MKISQRIHHVALFLVVITLGGCTLPFGKQNYAGLQVESDPKAEVYIDGKHAGETTYYDTKLKPAEHIVKLVPLSGATDAWETKVTLNPGLLTIIGKTFATTPQESGNYILELEKTSNKKTAELTIVTTPENAIVRLDDQPKGFSPLTNIEVTPDKHKVTLIVPGYKTQNISITTTAGYRVILRAELGKSLSLQPVATATPSATLAPTASPSPTPKTSASPTPLLKTSPTPTPKASPSPTPKATATTTDVAKPYVEVLTTPTGWLRVRSEPNGLVENEVAKLNTGDKVPFIESNDTGWYKVEYETGKQGWVAATYAKLVK
jgi:hypothetical protein